MPKLILSMDGLVLKEVQLDKDRFTIGRKPHNDIQIDNMAISGEHAVITVLANDAFLEDLDSTNGTLVNGQTVKRRSLQNNDLIDMGKYRIKFLLDPPPENDRDALPTINFSKTDLPPAKPAATADKKSKGKFDNTASVYSASRSVAHGAPSNNLTLALEGEEPAKPALTARIKMIGAVPTREVPINKSLTTLGKNGHRVKILQRPDGYVLLLVEGNASVNQKVLTATMSHDLKNHDIIELPSYKLEFLYS